MSIWEYRSYAGVVPPGEKVWRCLYCPSSLRCAKRGRSEPLRLPAYSSGVSFDPRRSLLVCDNCGWWFVEYISWNETLGRGDYSTLYWWVQIYRGSAALKTFDQLEGIEALDELQNYLKINYEGRFWINPWRFEKLVASIYRNMGYRARVTPRTGDGGVDIFVFDGKTESEIAVQVKRSKRKIEAEHIRAFTGALVVEGVTRGIYVTTSSFTKGARATAERLKPGYRIELVDAEKFYDRLSFVKRDRHFDIESESDHYYSLLHDDAELDLAYSAKGSGE